MDSDSDNENVSVCFFIRSQISFNCFLFSFFQEFNPDFQFDFEVCVNRLSMHFIILMFKIVQDMSKHNVMYGTRIHYSR